LSLWSGATDAEVARTLSNAGVATLDAHAAGDAAATDVPTTGTNPGLDQDALILFTSGTTGQPKGVVHTHRSLRAQWKGLRDTLGLDPFRRTLCLLPTHFGHGLICNCLFPWLHGQHLFILPPFKADVIVGLGALLDEHGIPSVVGADCLALGLRHPRRRAPPERVCCGSAPLSAALWRQIREWTGAREVWNAYGITETASWLAGTSVPDFAPEDGLIGVPWGGVIKVLHTADPATPVATAPACAAGESGYVWVNTPALMRGYFGRDDLTAQVVANGWFVTGDIGFLDERGWLYCGSRARGDKRAA
jgi:long-chain acyl-CoA synthetase